MKPIPAIVEQHIDVDLIAEQIIVALAGEREATSSAVRHEQLGAAARETAKARRIEIGRLLLKTRAAWPERGPNAKGWGEFLKRIGIDQSTAWRYMHPDQPEPGAVPKVSCEPHENIDRDATPANVLGASGEANRGTYCTPKKYADAVGPWDLDPFSNPRSSIVSTLRCMLEDGGDGLADASTPGSFRLADGSVVVAMPTTRVYLQPPYARKVIERVISHYKHTRFCALLRFAPETGWFTDLWPCVRVIAIPRERLPFETPDGVELEGADAGEDRGAPFPHVFYYRDERDVTDEIRRLCIVLRVDSNT